MAEYIEREALLAAYDKAHVGPPGGARKLIAEAPSADVVPVVRCEDCEVFNADDKFCRGWEIFVREKDFCSLGKRKDG